jgi:hypothetical protein
MPTLSKTTIQKLAVLRAVSLWKAKGAFGTLRIQKTLFFADDQAARSRSCPIFTFKRWKLGQYSDDIAAALNGLRDARRIETAFDGESERISASISPESDKRVEAFFHEFFPAWSKALVSAFKEWGYLPNDEIIANAHDHESYKASQHGEVILESSVADRMEFGSLDSDEAEFLLDLVDERLQRGFEMRGQQAAGRPAKGEDWRKTYFGGKTAVE